MFQVSIIIVNYNTFDYTFNCIASIIQKTKGITFEIIVVDNASENFDSIKLQNLSPNIKVIINQSNVGFAKANNIGIRESSGEVILLLNNDTYLINDAISLTYLELKDDLEIGVAGCKLLNENHSWQRSFHEFPTIFNQIKRLFRIKRKSIDVDKKQAVDWLTGAFLMFKKENLRYFVREELNDDFFMYCEDIQWGFNFRKNDLLAYYLPEGNVVHYHGKSSSYDSDFNKKLKFYYPNLMKLLKMEYGYFYAKTYFFLLIIIFLSDFNHNSLKKNIIPLMRIFFNIKNS